MLFEASACTFDVEHDGGVNESVHGRDDDSVTKESPPLSQTAIDSDGQAFVVAVVDDFEELGWFAAVAHREQADIVRDKHGGDPAG